MKLSAEQRAASYRLGWSDSLRAYSQGYGFTGPSHCDYCRAWWDCARERWRDPTRRGSMPEGVPVPQSETDYLVWVKGRLALEGKEKP